MASHSCPSIPWKIAWQRASLRRPAEAPSYGPSTLVVSMKVRTAPSSCARVSTSAPSRMTAPGKSALNFGFTTFQDVYVLLQATPSVGAMILLRKSCTFTQNVLRNAQAAFSFRFNLLVAFLHFFSCPCTEVAVFLEFFLVAFPLP